MFSFSDVLNTVKAAAKARIATLAGEVAPEIPKLTDEGFNFLTSVVAPKLDIPPVVIDIAKTQVATVESAAEPFEQEGLSFLVARIEALL